MMSRWVGVFVFTALAMTGERAGADADRPGREMFATPGETLDLGSVYEAWSWSQRDTHSVTVRLESGSTRRIFQFITSVDRMFVTNSYEGRVRFDPGSGSLQLMNFTERDAGIYLVTLTDRQGTERTARTRVKVYEPVLGAAIHANVTTATISLLCESAAGTSPVIRWARAGAEEGSSGAIVAATSRAAAGMVSEGGRRLTLALGDPATCGLYTCLVENQLNAETVNFSITESDGFSFCRELHQPGARNYHASVAVISIILILLLTNGVILLVDGVLKRKRPPPTGSPQLL